MISRNQFVVPSSQAHLALLDAVHANDVDSVKKIVLTFKSANVPLLENALWIAERGHDVRIYNRISDRIKALSA